MGSIVNTIGPASTLPNEGFETYLSETTKIDVPFTTITNRAKIINLAADGGVRFGVNRIMIQNINKVQDEFGANGEPVYSIAGDKFDQIRLIGTDITTVNGGTGQGIVTTTAGTLIEITFYGTGLNILDALYTIADYSDYDIYIDGALVNTVTNDASFSNILNGRNYSPNRIRTAASGLALGIHTARIEIKSDTVDGASISGFEILNESTQLDIRPNTAYVGGEPTLITQTTTDYNSGFTNEYGTSGTKGGHVVVYVDSDGVVHKDIQYVDVTPQYMGSTDHSNEEIIRNYHWREFGAGRTDDFSTMSGTGDVDKAFTLDDGTTTLVCNNCDVPTGFNVLRLPAIGSYYTFTFIGTGLAFGNPSIAASGVDISTTVEIDGVNIGDLNGAPRDGSTVEICSGLPYGVHTVKVTTQAAGQVWNVSDFIVYGPKKPTLPNNSVELASYYLMADYDNSTIAATASSLINSIGTLRKMNTREMIYSGAGISVNGLNVGFPSGFDIRSAQTNDYIEYTFFGDSFDYFILTNSGMSFKFSLDGSSDFDAAGITVTNHQAVGSFNGPTGDYNGNGGTTLSFTGLTLGQHTVRITNNTNVIMFLDGFTYHTPIHSYKQNKPTIQSASEVGSQAIADTRNFKAFQVDEKDNWILAETLDNYSSTVTTYVPLPRAQATIKTTNNAIEISFDTFSWTDSSGVSVSFRVLVNGEVYGIYASGNGNAGQGRNISFTTIADVEPGFHHVSIEWLASSSTRHTDVHRLIVKEL